MSQHACGAQGTAFVWVPGLNSGWQAHTAGSHSELTQWAELLCQPFCLVLIFLIEMKVIYGPLMGLVTIMVPVTNS